MTPTCLSQARASAIWSTFISNLWMTDMIWRQRNFIAFFIVLYSPKLGYSIFIHGCHKARPILRGKNKYVRINHFQKKWKDWDSSYVNNLSLKPTITNYDIFIVFISIQRILPAKVWYRFSGLSYTCISILACNQHLTFFQDDMSP